MLETAPPGTLLSCLICFHISAAQRLDVGASVMPFQRGKSNTEGLHLPSDCLAQRAAMPIRVSSTYQRDLVLIHAAYASFFKQQNCLRPFSCRDGTGAGVQLAETKAKGGIPSIPVLLQNPSYELCCKHGTSRRGLKCYVITWAKAGHHVAIYLPTSELRKTVELRKKGEYSKKC